MIFLCLVLVSLQQLQATNTIRSHLGEESMVAAGPKHNDNKILGIQSVSLAVDAAAGLSHLASDELPLDRSGYSSGMESLSKQYSATHGGCHICIEDYEITDLNWTLSSWIAGVAQRLERDACDWVAWVAQKSNNNVMDLAGQLDMCGRDQDEVHFVFPASGTTRPEHVRRWIQEVQNIHSDFRMVEVLLAYGSTSKRVITSATSLTNHILELPGAHGIQGGFGMVRNSARGRLFWQRVEGVHLKQQIKWQPHLDLTVMTVLTLYRALDLEDTVHMHLCQ